MTTHTRFLIALTLAAVAFPSVSSARPGDPKSDFNAAIEQVHRTMDARKWKDAKALLVSTLEAHKDQAYVQERIEDVRGMLKSCSFRTACPVRGVKDVFCGEVRSYDPKTGMIELSWERPKSSKAGAAKESFPCKDFEATKWGTVLLVPFDGPHSIELSGKEIGQDVPEIRVCIEGERAYELKLDAGSMCSLQLVIKESHISTASSTTSFNVLRPYTLKVAVREGQIDASHNGVRLVLGDKKKEDFGRVGFRNVLEPQKIKVQGKASSAWIDERIEALSKQDLEAFEKTYDANADLPTWLRKT